MTDLAKLRPSNAEIAANELRNAICPHCQGHRDAPDLPVCWLCHRRALLPQAAPKPRIAEYRHLTRNLGWEPYRAALHLGISRSTAYGYESRIRAGAA
jgi:hypothetical protein